MTLSRFWKLTLACWLLAASTASAQTRKPVQQNARTNTTQSKQTKAKTPVKKSPTKTAPKAQKPKTKAAPQPTIKGLQNQRQQIQQKIKEQENRLQANRKNVKQRLQNLQIINTEIADKQRIIDTIRHDINVLDGNIAALDIQIKSLEERLQQRKDNYMKSMRYMHRNRSVQNHLMFIFSAQNFTQMYRRLRFTREYAQYQRAQGEAVKTLQEEIRKEQQEMTANKQQKSDLLSQGEQEQRNLENKQVEQQKVVKSLQREQKTIESLITEQRKKDAALNAQIEKLIAEELARAEAEARRKAAEAAAKKRAEELARKKAAAEAAARENERRIAEAKAREERAKQQALAAKSASEKAAAKQAAREAEQARQAAEQKAHDDAKAHEREMAEAKKNETPKIEKADFSVSNEDRRLSGNFESNRGRLPMPITGNYRIVSGFGQNSINGLKGVRLDNKGMNIEGQSGAQARSIFDGEVCAVFDIRGVMGVMVRHGSYISVYSNLSAVSVRRGQKVSTRQTLGTIGSERILHFQLRKGSAAQNPASWLGR